LVADEYLFSKKKKDSFEKLESILSKINLRLVFENEKKYSFSQSPIFGMDDIPEDLY